MVDLMLAGDEEPLRRAASSAPSTTPAAAPAACSRSPRSTSRRARKNGDMLRRRSIRARHPPVRPGGQPRDLRRLQVGPVHQGPDGRDADNIAFGSTLSNDRHAGQRFDYLLANPPYGKDWKRDEDAVRAEHERGATGRFGPGLPRISDGQLLFLLHMLADAKTPRRRLAHRHRHERLAALHRRRRQRRERDPPLGSWKTTCWRR